MIDRTAAVVKSLSDALGVPVTTLRPDSSARLPAVWVIPTGGAWRDGIVVDWQFTVDCFAGTAMAAQALAVRASEVLRGLPGRHPGVVAVDGTAPATENDPDIRRAHSTATYRIQTLRS